MDTCRGRLRIIRYWQNDGAYVRVKGYIWREDPVPFRDNMIELGLSKGKAKEMPYYRKFIPGIDWYWMLIIGVVIGAFISSYLSGTFSVMAVPSFFAAAVGPDAGFRFIVALIGGILIGLGARWAGGCTSRHGISGTLQLALSSWVAAACFFIGGILVAGLLFGFRFL